MINIPLKPLLVKKSLLQDGNDDEAKNVYLETIGVDATYVETFYNLRLVSKMKDFVKMRCKFFSNFIN
jgi:hypothetical protein